MASAVAGTDRQAASAAFRSPVSQRHTHSASAAPVASATAPSSNSGQQAPRPRHRNRHWSHGPAPSNGSFTLFSYNILAPSLVLSHPHLHRGTPRTVHQNRTNAMLHELTTAACDIVCLQELEHHIFASIFMPALAPLSYVGHYLKRTGDQLDGVGIFVKTSRFKVLQVETVEYRTAASLGQRDNGAIVTLLQCLHTSSKLVVATTHLTWSPKRGEVKMAQVDALLEAVGRFVAMSGDPDTPVVLAGDFNLTPDGDIYKYIAGESTEGDIAHTRYMSGQNKRPSRGSNASNHTSTSSLAGSSPATISSGNPASPYQINGCNFTMPPPHAFALKSVYAPHRDASGPWVSTWHLGAKELVDFIFYGSKRAASDCRLVTERFLKLPRVDDMRLMPNKLDASDHHPIGAQMRLVCAKRPISGSLACLGEQQQHSPKRPAPSRSSDRLNED